MNDGFELRVTPGKGEGIAATRAFTAEEIVMVGVIEKVLEENDSHASQVAVNKFVRHGGFISKVNHSCDPNCGIKVNETGGHNFVAMREIEASEEITFDYAMRNYTIDYFAMSCECGAAKCRQQVTGYKDLSAARKKDYASFIAPYLLELDAKSSLQEASS